MKNCPILWKIIIIFSTLVNFVMRINNEQWVSDWGIVYLKYRIDKHTRNLSLYSGQPQQFLRRPGSIFRFLCLKKKCWIRIDVCLLDGHREMKINSGVLVVRLRLQKLELAALCSLPTVAFVGGLSWGRFVFTSKDRETTKTNLGSPPLVARSPNVFLSEYLGLKSIIGYISIASNTISIDWPGAAQLYTEHY